MPLSTSSRKRLARKLGGEHTPSPTTAPVVSSALALAARIGALPRQHKLALCSLCVVTLALLLWPGGDKALDAADPSDDLRMRAALKIDFSAVPSETRDEYKDLVMTAFIKAPNAVAQGLLLEKALTMYKGHAEVYNGLGVAYGITATAQPEKIDRKMLKQSLEHCKVAAEMAQKTHAQDPEFRAEAVHNYIRGLVKYDPGPNFKHVRDALEMCRHANGTLLEPCQELQHKIDLRDSAGTKSIDAEDL